MTAVRTAPQARDNSFSGTVLSEYAAMMRWRSQKATASSDHTHQKVFRHIAENSNSRMFDFVQKTAADVLLRVRRIVAPFLGPALSPNRKHLLVYGAFGRTPASYPSTTAGGLSEVANSSATLTNLKPQSLQQFLAASGRDAQSPAVEILDHPFPLQRDF